ncbi:MAG TPA: hypothetical protein VFT64_05770 [Rickettsiales bacterium]|nr:hypothetical protein [Rickettsiales bacterium]
MQNRPLPTKDSSTSIIESCPVSGLSWGAILGGSAVAIAVSLMLLILGSALGLSSLSPWSRSASDAASFTVKAAIWLIVMQWIASAFGGYITGRLRTKWTGMHTDEVFFRDTAHGFITWSVATLFAASVLGAATATVVNGGMHAAAFLSSGMENGKEMKEAEHGPHNPLGPVDYYTDKLLRGSPSVATQQPIPAAEHETRVEVSRILVQELKNDHVAEEDKQYLSQVIVANTGISQADANKRVDDVLAEMDTLKAKAKEKADEARKVSMKISLYIFASMLIGAFIASAAGALGGMKRDEY